MPRAEVEETLPPAKQAHDGEPAFSAKNRSTWATRDAGVPPDIDGLET
jgi:hypothetical protein